MNPTIKEAAQLLPGLPETEIRAVMASAGRLSMGDHAIPFCDLLMLGFYELMRFDTAQWLDPVSQLMVLSLLKQQFEDQAETLVGMPLDSEEEVPHLIVVFADRRYLAWSNRDLFFDLKEQTNCEAFPPEVALSYDLNAIWFRLVYQLNQLRGDQNAVNAASSEADQAKGDLEQSGLLCDDPSGDPDRSVRDGSPSVGSGDDSTGD